MLRGDDEALDDADRALARWARHLARDPSATTADDVKSLRDAGFDDAQIFAISAFVALRIAFSTVNNALGAQPDRRLGLDAPEAVRNAVTFGRPIAGSRVKGLSQESRPSPNNGAPDAREPPSHGRQTRATASAATATQAATSSNSRGTNSAITSSAVVRSQPVNLVGELFGCLGEEGAERFDEVVGVRRTAPVKSSR